MAVLDPRTGDVRAPGQGRGPDGLRARDVPVGGRVGPPARPERRADDGDPRLRDGPGHRRGAAGHAVRSPRAVQLEAPGRQDRGADATRRTGPASSILVPDASGPARVDRRRRRHRHPLITSTGATTAAEASYLQLRDAQWRPVGRAQRVDGYVAEAVFLPGGREVAIARDEVVDIHDARTLALLANRWRDTAARCSASSWPDRARVLLWTAGRDGTAVAFDLTGTRGVLRTVDLDVAANAGSAAGNRAAITQRYEIEPQHRAHPRPRRGARPLRRAPAVHRLRVPDRAHRHHPRRAAGPGRGVRVDRRLLGGDHRPRPGRRLGHRHRRAEAHHRHALGARRDWRSRPTGSGCSSTAPEGGLSTTSPRARRSGATRPTCRAAGSTACRCRAPPPTAPGWSCSGARP